MEATQNHVDFITILSIDGGGVRGIIPTTILQFLEEQLQILDGPNVRIADYFDVMSGTSTGGLIAGFLTAPDEKGRPRYNATDAMKIYTEDGTKIFPNRFLAAVNQILGPKHDVQYLEKLLKGKLEDLKIKDTVTEVIIPTFDIKLMQPTYFSTTGAKRNELKNAYVRDVLRGTSAAPTYFAPHLFDITSTNKESKTFNLVDGGMGMNNPAHLALLHALRLFRKHENTQSSQPISMKDGKNILVLSLGTGKVELSYDACEASKWGLTTWLSKDGHVPIIEIVNESSADLVDFNLAIFFHTQQCPDNYLRIQALNLAEDMSAMDKATTENIEKLKVVGEKLLDMPVVGTNLETGEACLEPDRGTNKDALKRFASLLSKEYNARRSLMQDAQVK